MPAAVPPQLLDQFLIATEMKFKYAWLGLYFFVVYIFYNVIYYYEHNVEDRVTFEVFDWDENPGRACLWVFLILAFGVPGFTALHVFVYRCVAAVAIQNDLTCPGVQVCCCPVGTGCRIKVMLLRPGISSLCKWSIIVARGTCVPPPPPLSNPCLSNPPRVEPMPIQPRTAAVVTSVKLPRAVWQTLNPLCSFRPNNE